MQKQNGHREGNEALNFVFPSMSLKACERVANKFGCMNPRCPFVNFVVVATAAKSDHPTMK